MSWKIQNGRPVKYSPPEVSIAIQQEAGAELLVCPECGREYKTETGLTNHISDKH